MSLEEQLKKLPKEFTIALEEAKGLQSNNTIDFILNLYKVKNDVLSLDDKDQHLLILMLKHIYNYGFYAGVSFALDPTEYIESNSK